MHNEPNAANATPTRANWAPFPAHFQTFNGGQKEQQKQLKGRRQTSLSEGWREKRLKVGTLNDGEILL